MKNREKYADEIKNFKGDFCNGFVIPKILKDTICGEDVLCAQCRMLQMLWLDEEVEETDWSKVPVDTKIYVRDNDGESWAKRHFAEFNGGTVYAFDRGLTSWSSKGQRTGWKQAKLAEEVEE